MKLPLSILLLFFIAMSARAQDSYLLLTSGGGMTGSAVFHKIQNDGSVWKGEGVAEINYDKKSKLKKGPTRRFFKKTRALLTKHPDFIHPGNMYSSITLFENGSERKITWGDANTTTPKDATKLYQKIDARLKKLTFSQELRK